MSESEHAEPVNPFAAPVSSAMVEPGKPNPNPLPRPDPLAVFIKWTVVCGFAAGPSFYFGGGMGAWRPAAVLGMLIGILIFVIGYTALEFTTAIQEQMNKPVSRRAAWIAYLTRAAISIVFPIGLTVDILCGIFSVGISSALTGISETPFHSPGDNFSEAFCCFQFAVTTVVQGVLLNLVLFAYMGIVWLVCKAISRD